MQNKYQKNDKVVYCMRNGYRDDECKVLKVDGDMVTILDGDGIKRNIHQNTWTELF